MRLTCPRCSYTTGIKHCPSPSCGWYVCNKCTVNVSRTQIVFDIKNRSFEGPKG